MKPSDWKGFQADEGALDTEDYVFETYFVETMGDPLETACHLCAEHSTALWSRPGRDEDFRENHGAKVVRLEVRETSPTPFFGSEFHRGDRFTRFHVRIAQPHVNFGPRIPNLLTAVCGEGAFFTPNVSAVKLIDLELPQAFLAGFEGPRFGIDGIRETLDAFDRPIFFGVVKPNVGLPPGEFAELAYLSWLGGLDAPKDDEMLADASYSPLAERSRLVGEARRKAEAETGRKLMYLANITDEVERLVELHDLVVENGANSVMVNGMATGLSSIRWLASKAKVPLVAHFDLIAPMARIPFFGVSTLVWTRLQRLAGFDAIIMPGFGGRMFTPESEVVENAKACVEPMGNLKPVLPVPGGSDWAGTLAGVHEKLGGHDFGFVPGRGVFGHPDGPRAGAASIVAAWEAIRDGRDLVDKARESSPLSRAIEAFG
ncbi:MAG: RuBisCO large subunit C-terminal-like domain-containing protein [Planctomycetota bacterium]|jgi:ribulose-bisphosphate carboxylase large chain